MLECQRCGTIHPDELREKWGQDGNGDGLGPVPCCPAIVDSQGAPIAEGDVHTPGHTCRGALQRTERELADGETPTRARRKR